MLRLPLLASVFRVTAQEYEKLRFSEADAQTATLFIWGVCLGVIAAALYTLYRQQTVGRVVHAILRAEALSEQSAKTAEELGLSSHPLAMRELTKGTSLRRLVQRVTTDGTTRFFIEEQNKYHADVRFDKKENNPATAIITIFCT